MSKNKKQEPKAKPRVLSNRAIAEIKRTGGRLARCAQCRRVGHNKRTCDR